MATYLRRMVVPEADVPHVINDIKATFSTPAEQIMTSRVKIGSRVYRIIRFIANKPYLYQSATLQRARNATLTEEMILQKIYATDLDIQAALVVDQTDFAAADMAVADDYLITVDLTDIDGVTNTLEFALTVLDATLAVITLTASAVNAGNAEAAADTWTPADNIASATDDGDDISASVTFTYYKDDADGDALSDLAAAQVWLETAGNVVYVEYDYTDAAGNTAVTKSATFTSVDTTPPVITLTGSGADVSNTAAATYDFSAYITSATDDVDGDVSSNVVITFKKTDASGDVLADLAAARAWLGVTGQSVYAMYNVDDAAGNSATEKTATFVGIAD